MLQTIFKYESIQLLRSKGIIISLLILMVIGFYCLSQGNAIYQNQIITVDSAMAKKARSYSLVKKTFDTLTYKSENRSDVEQPWVLEWRLQDVVAKEISPLSILSIGQNDVYISLLSGRFNGDYFKNNYAEFKNPEQLLAGNLDTSFFILFLFPLLLLTLTYNLQSADKEDGISPLLNAQVSSLQKMLRYRLLYRWMVALLPFIVIAAVSFFMLSVLPGFALTAFLQWWGIAFLYAIFWLILVAFVQYFQYSSLINAITLTSVWVLFLIAIPGLLNTWLNYKYPAANKTEIAEYRDFDFKAWNISIDDHKKYLFGIYPQLQKEAEKLDTNQIKTFSYSLQVFNREKELHGLIIGKADERASAEEKTFLINPVGGVMRSFATVSQTSLKHQQNFEKDVFAYREKKLKYLFEKMINQSHFTKNDFVAMPKLERTDTQNGLIKYLLPLITIVLIVILYNSIKNRNII
jgi:ABC-2 type transport system permease protein